MRLVLRVLRSDSGLYTLIVAILATLLSVSFLNSHARQRLLSLRSSTFTSNDESRLLFISVSFIIACALVFLILKFVRTLNPLQNDFQMIQFFPAFIFIAFVVSPSYFQYFQGKPMFTDFLYTINFLIDNSVQKVSDNNLIYPSSFLWLRYLPIPFENSIIQLLLLFGGSALFSLCIVHYARRLNPFQLIIFSLLLLSPPIRWLFQSQNIDFFIVSILYICASMYEDKLSIRNSIVLVFISLLALFKIYALSILIFLLLTSLVKAVRIQIFLCLMIVTPVIFFDATKILGLIPLDPDNNSVGLKVVLFFLGFSDSIYTLFLVLTSVLIFLGIFSSYTHSRLLNFRIFDFSNFVPVFNLIVFSSCFLMTSNYPFRLVYLLFFIPSSLNQYESTLQILSASFATIAFLAYAGSLGIIMNFFLLPFVFFSTFSLIQLFKERFFPSTSKV